MKLKNCFRLAGLVLVVVAVTWLAACGNSDVQSEQPSVGTSPNNPTEPSSYSGIWICMENCNVLVDYADYALLYDFEWDNDYSNYYLQDMYECEYQWDGDELTLSAYGADGELNYTNSYISGGGMLREVGGDGEDYVRVSANVGMKGDLVGTWYYFTPSTGLCMHFYNDGSFLDEEFHGRGMFTDDGGGGQYTLTSKYDMPAMTVYDDDGSLLDTYRYEFLDTNLLVIYESYENQSLRVFYRHPYDPNKE